MRAIWRPWVPKWGAQRDQTWSQWFILMYISIFYSFSTKDKQSGPLQKNQKKKTRFPDFYSTVIRKTAILQRKESSNQKIQEKEPLLTFKNTCKKVWAKRKYQFLALWPHSQRALMPIYTSIYLYIPCMYVYVIMHTHIYPYISIYTHIYPYIHIYTHIYPYTVCLKKNDTL